MHCIRRKVNKPFVFNRCFPVDIHVYDLDTIQETRRDVVLLYRPESVEGVNRTHIVASDYLEAHRTATSFLLDTEDVEEWLALKTPGVLSRVHPQCKFERQLQLECIQSLGGTPSHYSIPLAGGHFESTSPEVDVYVCKARSGRPASGMPRARKNSTSITIRKRKRCARDVISPLLLKIIHFVRSNNISTYINARCNPKHSCCLCVNQ